jgi:hypothetical protein
MGEAGNRRVLPHAPTVHKYPERIITIDTQGRPYAITVTTAEVIDRKGALKTLERGKPSLKRAKSLSPAAISTPSFRCKPESRSLRRKPESRKFDQRTGSRLAPGRRLCAYINACAAKRLTVLKAPLRRRQINPPALSGDCYSMVCLGSADGNHVSLWPSIARQARPGIRCQVSVICGAKRR